MPAIRIPAAPTFLASLCLAASLAAVATDPQSAPRASPAQTQPPTQPQTQPPTRAAEPVEGQGAVEATPGRALVRAASAWLASLEPAQRSKAQVLLDHPSRFDWHYVPKARRKGLPLAEMTPAQRELALATLKAGLSAEGHAKALGTLELERVLHAHSKRSENRNPARYFFTVFGEPSGKERWGLSVEGHHLSVNLTVHRGELVSVTPLLFAANPAELDHPEDTQLPKGFRPLAAEETQALELLGMLDPAQRARAVVAAKSPGDLDEAGRSQPVDHQPVGLSGSDMKPKQQEKLLALCELYLRNAPSSLAAPQVESLRKAGAQPVHFAFAGDPAPGKPHSYRVFGPGFVIHFYNTQADAYGRPANHVHALLRSTTSDFGGKTSP